MQDETLAVLMTIATANERLSGSSRKPHVRTFAPENSLSPTEMSPICHETSFQRVAEKWESVSYRETPPVANRATAAAVIIRAVSHPRALARLPLTYSPIKR